MEMEWRWVFPATPLGDRLEVERYLAGTVPAVVINETILRISVSRMGSSRTECLRF